MATKQVILYPISDVNLSHTCSNGNVGYSLINDPASTPDDGSSYIYVSVGRGNSENTTSTFKVSESSIDKKFVLSALTTTVRAMVSNSNLSGSVQSTLSVNGGTTARSARSNRLTTSYANSTYTFTNVVGYNEEFNSFADANITLGINTTSVNNADKDNTYQIRITQAYVTATYIPIHTCNAVNAEGCTSVSVSSMKYEMEIHVRLMQHFRIITLLLDGTQILNVQILFQKTHHIQRQLRGIHSYMQERLSLMKWLLMGMNIVQ